MQRKVSVRSSPNYSTLGRCSSYQCMSDWRSSAARRAESAFARKICSVVWPSTQKDRSACEMTGSPQSVRGRSVSGFNDASRGFHLQVVIDPVAQNVWRAT
jgi:hypothetical protein